MEAILKISSDELIKKFNSLKTRVDLADILEIEDKFLAYILYGIKDRTNYRNFEIQKKSNKKRLINVPPKNLAILQSKLHQIIKLVYMPKNCVHGFAKDKSILSNAKQHYCKRYVLNIDLKNFSPTIDFYRVRGAFMSHPFKLPYEVALIIAQVCCTDEGLLPQGGATSPIISNIICRKLDNELMSLADTARCYYTRYADDITFSTRFFHLPEKLAVINHGEITLSEKLIKIINNNGFQINEKKTRCNSFFSQQEVTGLTVNEYPNVKRSFVRSIQGALNAWGKHEYDRANKHYLKKYLYEYGKGSDLQNVTKGKILFLKMVLGESSPLYRKIAKKYNHLAKREELPVKSLEELAPYPLRGDFPQNHPWKFWFSRYRESIAYLITEDFHANKNAATAFHIGKGRLGTALHNLKNDKLQVMIGDVDVEFIDKYPTYDEKTVDVGVINLKPNTMTDKISLPTQLRLPEIGEEVVAIGFPTLPLRHDTLVMHLGVIEALPLSFDNSKRYIQVSFHSGGGLSGGPLIDKRGFVVGVMIENICRESLKVTIKAVSEDSTDKDEDCKCNEINKKGVTETLVDRPYGQAVPIEYLADMLDRN